MENVDLRLAEDALEAISSKAIERKAGARGLRSIMEMLLLDIMFDLPDIEGVEQVVISKQVVEALYASLGTVDPSDDRTRRGVHPPAGGTEAAPICSTGQPEAGALGESNLDDDEFERVMSLEAIEAELTPNVLASFDKISDTYRRLLAILTVFLGVKTVPQGCNWTVERFGGYTRTLRPGLNLVVPFMTGSVAR
jgi:C-terminal, D2-small domain, of ClpB protein